MSKFLLTSKRKVLRNLAPFNTHFICTWQKRPIGAWLNIKELKEATEEERIAVLTELMSIL